MLRVHVSMATPDEGQEAFFREVKITDEWTTWDMRFHVSASELATVHAEKDPTKRLYT